jgi:hypothetical protein
LFAVKPDHPMADVKQAKALVAKITDELDLANGEEFKADH